MLIRCTPSAPARVRRGGLRLRKSLDDLQPSWLSRETVYQATSQSTLSLSRFGAPSSFEAPSCEARVREASRLSRGLSFFPSLSSSSPLVTHLQHYDRILLTWTVCLCSLQPFSRATKGQESAFASLGVSSGRPWYSSGSETAGIVTWSSQDELGQVSR